MVVLSVLETNVLVHKTSSINMKGFFYLQSIINTSAIVSAEIFVLSLQFAFQALNNVEIVLLLLYIEFWLILNKQLCGYCETSAFYHAHCVLL